MFADLMVWDDVNQGEVEEELIDVVQARDRIAALDGRTRTLVTLYAGDSHLAVGGDAATGLVVYATFDNDVFYQMVTGREGDNGEVVVVAGGQPGSYSARNVVSRDEAVMAAEVFARLGRLAVDFAWSEQ